MKPRVTIGLVTFNRAHVLRQAIESVLRQTFRDFELIVSDDNSTDHTYAVVRDYLDDKRVRYIRRSGVGMTQNFLVTLRDAKGEYFIWLCDDDYFSVNYLELCVDFLSANRSFALVCGVTKFCREGQIIDRVDLLNLEQNNSGERVFQYFRHVNSNVILYGLMRTEEALKFIYPDTFCADLLWSSQVVFSGKVKILSETEFFYSLNGISETTSALQQYYKTTRGKAANPYQFMRKELMSLIFRKDTVFSILSYFTKVVVCARLWFILRERFMMPKFESRLRGALRIRTRLQTLFR